MLQQLHNGPSLFENGFVVRTSLTTDEFPMWDDYLNPSLRYVIVLKDLLSTNANYCTNNCLFAEGDHDRNEFILTIIENWSSGKDTSQ